MNLFEDYMVESDDEDVDVDIDESFDDDDLEEACKSVDEEDEEDEIDIDESFEDLDDFEEACKKEVNEEDDDNDEDEVDDDKVMESAIMYDEAYDIYSTVCEGKDCCDEEDIDFDSVDNIIDPEVSSTPVIVPDFVNILGADLTDFVLDPSDEDIDIRDDEDIDNILIDDEI